MRSMVPGYLTVHARIHAGKATWGNAYEGPHRTRACSLPTAGRLRQFRPKAITDRFRNRYASTHVQRRQTAFGSDPRSKGAKPFSGGRSAKASGETSPNGLDPPDQRPLAGRPSHAVDLHLGRGRGPRLHHKAVCIGSDRGDGQLGELPPIGRISSAA